MMQGVRDFSPSRSVVPLLSALVTSLFLGAAALGGDDFGFCDGQNDGPCFAGLGDLPGGQTASQAFGVSATGMTTVGLSGSDTSLEAFRWTISGGMEGLGFLTGGSESRALASDAVGETIVGSAVNIFDLTQGFRWTDHGGMEALAAIPGGVESNAISVSNDGAVVAGWTNYSSGATQAQVWTDTGTIGLGYLRGGSDASRAVALSGDGSVVVGWGNSGVTEAFRWTVESGMVGLGFLPGAVLDGSQAFSVSNDGSVVVGMSWSPNGIEGFKWTEDGGMMPLGDLRGGSVLDFSFAFDVSADGRVTVGSGQDDTGGVAVIWDDEHGIRKLQTVLVNDYGLDLSGWQLAEAKSISADGTTIVGWGWHDKVAEGWIAKLPAPCRTDLDGNGATDAGDLNLMLNDWGAAGSAADLNADGTVDEADLVILLAMWGPCP